MKLWSQAQPRLGQVLSGIKVVLNSKGGCCSLPNSVKGPQAPLLAIDVEKLGQQFSTVFPGSVETIRATGILERWVLYTAWQYAHCTFESVLLSYSGLRSLKIFRNSTYTRLERPKSCRCVDLEFICLFVCLSLVRGSHLAVFRA